MTGRNRVTKLIRWIARIWSFPIIAYALLLIIYYSWNLVTIGVADPKAVKDYPPIEALPPIFIFLSIFGLSIAWRWEQLGGIITIVFQLVAFSFPLIYSLFAQDFPHLAVPYFLLMIIVTPGLLFLVCWWRSRDIAKASN